MSLVLLPNNVWPDAAYLAVTDGSDVATTDTAGAENITGGPRSLAWSSSDASARRLVYVNKSGGLACSHIVLARADVHDAKDVTIRSWTNYASTSTAEYNTASFAETLVGPREQDWVYALPLSSKQAIGITFNSTDYIKHVYKFYVSNGITLNYTTASEFRVLPFPTRHVHRRQMCLVDTEWQFTAEEMTRAEVDAFEAIPNLLAEPMFLYDSAGHHIYHKLVHGFIVDPVVTAVFDDLYQLTFRVLELRSWL